MLDPRPQRPRLRALLCVATACVCASGARPAGAEEDDAPVLRAETIDVHAEDPEAVVFRMEPIEKQRVDREVVKSIPGNDASAIVATLPGFRIQQRVQGQQAAVSIEGMPPENTLILVNGQRYTGAIGEVADLRDVPLTNIDYIEVQRGSQVLRNSSDAAGGVISVVTRPPPAEDGLGLSAEGGGGTDGRYLGMVTGGARKGPIGLTLSYTRDQIDGYDRRGSGARFVGLGGDDSTTVIDDYYARLVAEIGDAATIRGSLGWRVRDDDYVGQGAFEGDDLGTRTTHRVLGGLGGRWDVTEFAAFDMEVFYYGHRVRDTVGREIILDEREVRVDPKLDFYFSVGPTDHTFTVGADIRYTDVDLETGSVEFDPVTEAQQLQTLTQTKESITHGGPFVDWEASLLPWLDLLAGVRAQFDTRYEPVWTPQVALLARAHSTLSFRAQYGRSRRTPSLRQMYLPEMSQNGGAYYLRGNAELEPEDTHTYRLGFEWQPRQWAVFAATGFYNDLEDHIRAVNAYSVQVATNEVSVVRDPNDVALVCQSIPFEEWPNFPFCAGEVLVVPSPVYADVSVFQNIQVARTAGVEVQSVLHPHELVDLRFGYTFLRSYVEYDGLPDLSELPNEPRHTLNLNGQLRAPRISSRIGKPQLGVDVRYRGASLQELSGTGFANFTSTSRTDPSWVVDMRLTLPFLEDDRAAVYFDVFNVTNEATVDSYEIRGRSYFAGVRFALDSQPH